MEQMEQYCISDYLKAIDNIDDNDEERESLLSPERYILDLCFPSDEQNDTIPFGFYEHSSQQQLDNEIHCIYNKFGLKVIEGKVSRNGLQGNVKTYFDGELLMDANYLNNVKEGLCTVYRNRRVMFYGYYSNGKPKGIATEYDPELKQYSDVEYDNSGKPIFRLVDNDGCCYILRGQENYYLGCSCYSISEEDGIRHFKEEGYCYDKNDVTGTFSYKKRDQSVCLLREMNTKENTMGVYSEIPYLNEQSKLVYKQVKCYEGEYEDSFAKGFPRCGRGSELYIQPSTSKILYTCNAVYNDDKIIEDFQIFDENELVICNAQVDTKKDCVATLFDPQQDYDMVYHGIIDDWNATVTLSSPQELNDLSSLSVSSLIISSHFGENMDVVDFSHLHFLQSIRIGSECFPQASSVYFYHLPFLQSIVIEKYSFSNSLVSKLNTRCINMLPEDTKATSFVCIKQNHSLTEIHIEDHCFASFSHLIIEDNPLLTNLTIGSVAEPSDCQGLSFYNAKEFCLQQLPHLRLLQIGNNSFMNASTCILSNLMNLKHLQFGYCSFLCCSKCHFINLPKLEEIEFQNAFMSCQEAFFIVTPLLSRLNSRSLYSFSNLASLHLLEANPSVQQFLVKNPLKTAIIHHNNVKFFDPFHCIHFKNQFYHLDLDENGSYWEGPVTEEGEPYLTGCLVQYENDDYYTHATTFINGKMNGWSRVYKGDLGTDCLRREYLEELIEEGCYLNDEKTGLFTEYLGNNKKRIKGYYHNNLFLSQFVPDFQLITIDDEFLTQYHQLTQSHLLHPVVFATERVSIQAAFPHEPLFLLNTVLVYLDIKLSQGVVVPSFILSHLPYLQTLSIEEGSFANEACNGSFHIQHCPELTQVHIHSGSCCYFSSFLLAELPKLTSLKIGDNFAGEYLNCFDSIQTFVLPSCPALSEIVFGNSCFRKVKVFRFGVMPNLTSWKIGDDTLKSCLIVYLNYCSNFLFEFKRNVFSGVRALYCYTEPGLNSMVLRNRLNPAFTKESDIIL